MKLDPKLIAEAWLHLRSERLPKSEYAVGSWVDEAIDLAIYNDADYAFEIIEAMHDLHMGSKQVTEFAAGPVENLLSNQGVALIDRFETKAAQDRRFALMLHGVWQQGMIDDVWERIVKCRGSEG